jgi:hypothetical protein
MPIASVLLTDTLDQWRIKTNQMISVVNTLSGSGTILSVNTPVAGQILVCDGTVFKNVTVTGDLAMSSTGVATIVGGASALTKGRMRFAGSLRGLY